MRLPTIGQREVSCIWPFVANDRYLLDNCGLAVLMVVKQLCVSENKKLS